MSFVKVKSEPGDGRPGDQGGPSRGGQVVHVRGDSETELDLLFSVLKDSKQPPGQTFRDKNLPPSFFNPPEPKPGGGGSHSREGSLDFGQVGAHHQQQQQLQSGPGGMAVFHVRSHSSPAQLPVSLSLPSVPGVHLKQGSADLIGDNQATKYFVNNPSNAWQTEQCKPHDVASGPTGVAAGKQQGHNGIPNQGNTGLLQQSILDSSQVALGSLPQGWEQGVTAEGDIYFINHNDKTTSWYDPRLPKHLQKPGALKVGAGQQQPQAAQQTAHRQQPVSQQGAMLQSHGTLPPTNQMAKQQVHQPNHITKQQFLHQQNQLLMKQPLPTAVQLRASPSVIAQAQQQSMRTVTVPDQIQLELHKLRKERERLIQEQEENKRKEQMLLKELLKHEMVPPNSLMVTPAMQQQMTISGVDPFLGQTVMGSDIHARQNSGDSGLGSCYSLPRTPEDFLGNVDALDRHDISNMQKKQQHHHAQQQQQQQLCDFGVNPRQGSLGALDMAPLGDTLVEPMAMDSDELVSTLTDDLELGRDFLEMQMMDILL